MLPSAPNRRIGLCTPYTNISSEIVLFLFRECGIVEDAHAAVSFISLSFQAEFKLQEVRELDSFLHSRGPLHPVHLCNLCNVADRGSFHLWLKQKQKPRVGPLPSKYEPRSFVVFRLCYAMFRLVTRDSLSVKGVVSEE